MLRQIEPVEGQWSTIYTDSAYFVRGAALPSHALLARANGDIWLSRGQQVRRHGGRVQCVKVLAHMTLQDVSVGVLTMRVFLGNLVALDLENEIKKSSWGLHRGSFLQISV